ncbi:MAG: sulfurtransferase complex subunit TusD [Methylococcaceae bacterium]|nr:sulfurtransferase complex subunit TusD [Methylococcaceae bacterium]
MQVNSAPYSGQGSETAYRFARAALQEGHEIYRVFFYFEGIYNALAQSGPPDDEKDIVKRWASLAIQQNIDLVICVSAAMRRGLAQPQHSGGSGVHSLVARGFRISGLGQWVEAAIEADRLLVFGD